jgi:tetratricopeptide (TPR) repeat protein
VDCIRLYLLLSAAYCEVNRFNESAAIAEAGLAQLGPNGDVMHARELYAIIQRAGRTGFRDSGKEKSADELRRLQRVHIGSAHNQLPEAVVVEAVKTISNATGNELIDRLILVGYAKVNSRDYDVAGAIFSALLKHDDNILAAHLALGSINALKGAYPEAIDAFSKAIEINPTVLATPLFCLLMVCYRLRTHGNGGDKHEPQTMNYIRPSMTIPKQRACLRLMQTSICRSV